MDWLWGGLCFAMGISVWYIYTAYKLRSLLRAVQELEEVSEEIEKLTTSIKQQNARFRNGETQTKE